MKKPYLQILFILILSSVLGIGTNLPLVNEYYNGAFQHGFFSLERYPSIMFIKLSEAKDLFHNGEAIFIDSRIKKNFQGGHILGAINIPFVKYKNERDLSLQSIPVERILVVYCDGNNCQSSMEMAKLLHKKGFNDIRVFFGGWAEWIKEGLPVSSKNDSK